MKYVLSPRIGDGKEPETAFRPQLGDTNEGTWFDLENGFFVCAVKEPITLAVGDIEFTLDNIDQIKAKFGISTTTIEITAVVREIINKEMPKFRDRPVRIAELKVRA